MSPSPPITVQNAVILAAGRGSRLSPEDEGASKALIRLGDETIIDFQIRALESLGIRQIAVVTGFKADEVCGHLAGHPITRTFHNPDFATTNSLYSLTLAEEVVLQGAVVLNSDVLFHPSLLQRLLENPAPNAILVDFDSHLDEEEMKVCVADSIVTAISKGLKPEPGMGENVGMIKIGAAAAPHYMAEARALFAAGDLKAWAPRGIHLLVGKQPFRAIPVDGVPWTEIDFPEDLVHAREHIYPLCRTRT